jgi:FkbM family methyltransferase
VGSHDGQAVDDFINWSGGQYERIHAFELMSESTAILSKKYADNSNFKLYNMGVGNEDGFSNFTEYAGFISGKLVTAMTSAQIKCVKLDTILENENVTYIKINSCGTEMDVLAGSEKLLKRCLPKLGVAIFMQDDLWWNVPQFIWSISEGYQIYFRQYPTNASVCYAFIK